MFVFWSKTSEDHVTAMLTGEQHQAAEHDAAVLRLIEQARASGDEVTTGAVFRPARYHDGRDQ
jgi:hypothetical protein